jgi:Effector Associated Constant Component 1
MTDLILRVERRRTSSSADTEGIRQYHEERGQFIQEVIEKFKLEPKSLVDTHPDGRPREWAELIAALGDAGVVAGIVTLATSWITRRRIENLKIEVPGGPSMEVKGGTAEDIERIVAALKR